jgi:hypothetical protein
MCPPGTLLDAEPPLRPTTKDCPEPLLARPEVAALIQRVLP